jgi:DNA-binding response OmpR family regulator
MATTHLFSTYLSKSYDVRVANDGAAALAEALAFPPNVVVTDVMMPQLDGYELVERLRSVPGFPRMGVIFVSARGGTQDVLEGIRHGAFSYLPKPVALDALGKKVAAAVRHASIPPPPRR